ncbi:fungal protein [Schizosaccharomyces japonicus yFS275]|uniref:Fungal protein n=1 Tax=Schizosaccharomyces japonicus (strain yFS275 / FY16936) TaxID=402676 RepID=B6JZ89_SCHJY|nr:fungal protein [Schizosaccharomyces japonicus yFS275]EEB06857.1 fungal protein [Schizosaccharomyces japonicus yFS275]
MSSFSSTSSTSPSSPASSRSKLDSFVAELISKNAQEKQNEYRIRGAAAYLNKKRTPSRTDKGFLHNILQRVDSHNEYKLKQRRVRILERHKERENAVMDHSDPLRLSRPADVPYKSRRREQLSDSSCPPNHDKWVHKESGLRSHRSDRDSERHKKDKQTRRER